MSEPRWRRRPSQRRDELLDAALRLFIANGVAATTLQEIADEAGIAKATIYRYFPGRDGLVDALVERFYAQLLERGTVAAEGATVTRPDSSFADVIAAAMEATIRFLDEQRALIELLSRQPPSSGAERPGDTGLVQLAAGLAQAIEEANERGDTTVPDPAATAALLVHAVAGSVAQRIITGGGPSFEALIAAARQLVRSVLSPSPPLPDR